MSNTGGENVKKQAQGIEVQPFRGSISDSKSPPNARARESTRMETARVQKKSNLSLSFNFACQSPHLQWNRRSTTQGLRRDRVTAVQRLFFCLQFKYTIQRS